MNKATLKKQHFWILCGAVPLLVLLAFVLVVNNVQSAIDDQQKKIDAAAAQVVVREEPKSDPLLVAIERQKDDLKKKRQELWKANWERERPEFTWPVGSAKLQQVERLDLKFGDPIPNGNSEYDEFKRDSYVNEFTQMAAGVAPTSFRDGWEKVLRHVNDWTVKAPESHYLWLALEDVWVQRSLLKAVKAVNDRAALFSPPQAVDSVDPATKAKTRRWKCRSRIWEAELWLEPRGSDKVLRGRLKNITDRLQLLGVGNTLKLMVWLDNKGLDDERAAFEFQVEGEYVKAGGYAQAADANPAPVLKEIPSHVASASKGVVANGVFKVKQRFDVRTVPVRRVERLALNYADARHAADRLEPPDFKAFKEAPAGAAGADPAPRRRRA